MKKRRRRMMIAYEHVLQGTLVTPLQRSGELFARRPDDVNEDDHGNNGKNTKIPIFVSSEYLLPCP